MTPANYPLEPPGLPFARWSLPGRLAELAVTTPSAPFIQWGDSDKPPTTYSEFEAAVSEVAGALGSRGVTDGSRVTLLMRNSLQNVVCWFACESLGAVDVPINPAYRGRPLERQISHVVPSLIIADEEFVPALMAAIPPEANLIVNRLDAADAGELLPDFGIASTLPVPTDDRDPRGLASIYYTSGTTGDPKGVRIPHAQAFFYSHQTAALHRMKSDDVYVAPYPLFHASGRIHGVGSALVSGGSCVLYDKFSASRFAQRVAMSGGTVTHFLGSMMSLILETPESDADRDLPLRSVMALPCPPNAAARFRTRFDVENIAEVIGMTELSWPVMSPYGVKRPSGAAGRVVGDWYDIEIADPDTDIPRGVDEPGELLVRPRFPWIVSDGYENNDAATSASRRNLWFHTGDMVREDREGWFYYLDRLKDSIRRRGENISSLHVEEALIGFPGVAEVAVTGRQTETEEHDEEIYAFVIWTDGTPPDYEALHARAQRELPSFCLPDFYVTRQILPKTASGKVRKALLKEPAEEEAVVPVSSQWRG